MTGGGGADRFVIATGVNTVTIGGSGNAGTITGFDVITDFATASDTLDLQGTATVGSEYRRHEWCRLHFDHRRSDGQIARDYERHRYLR